MANREASVHVLLTFDVEVSEYIDLTKKLKQVISILESNGVPATFFLDGKTVIRFPEGIRLLRERGYELALHSDYHYGVSDSHSRALDFSIQESEMQITRLRDAIFTIRQVIPDFDPRGFRAPGLRWNKALYYTLSKLGFLYDSSQKVECFQPFLVNDIVVLPFNSKEFDSASYQLTTRGVLNRWVERLNEASQSAIRIGESYLVLLMHPTCIGRELYTPLLKAFFNYITPRTNVHVKFQTCMEAVRDYQREKGLLGKNALVLDASAIIGGFAWAFEPCYTVPEVLEEAKYYSKLNPRIDLQTERLNVMSPSRDSFSRILEEIQGRKGKGDKVSMTDMKLLALALDLKAKGITPIISAEDYHDQRLKKLAERVGVVYQQIFMEGISKRTRWSSVCPECGRENDSEDAFEVSRGNIKCACGSKLIRLVKKSYWAK